MLGTSEIASEISENPLTNPFVTVFFLAGRPAVCIGG